MSRSLGIAAVLLATAALVTAGLFLGLPFDRWLVELRTTLRDRGEAGQAAFVAAYVAATVLLLPGAPLSLVGGAVWGPFTGTALVSLASTLGAGCAFLVGRHLARPAVARWLESAPRLAFLDRAVAASGWKIVALARLSPALPFNLLNYAFGLTRIRFSTFLAVSWLAMLPGTFVYVAGAAAASDAATAPVGAANWPLLAGIAATAALTLLLARIARQALSPAGGLDPA